MYFSPEFIQRVKSTVSLVDLVSRYTQLKREGNAWIGHCPNPSHADKTPSFRVYQNHGEWYWTCMGCHNGKKDDVTNFGTDCIAFVRWMSANTLGHTKSFSEAVEFLAKLYNIPLQESKQLKEYSKQEALCTKYQHIVKDATAYLFSRGLSQEDIILWRIGYDADTNRITIPIRNKDFKVLGFSKRLLAGEGSKYWTSYTSQIFRKSENFFGQEFIQNTCSDIYIAEGVFDVILAHKYKLDNVVCPLGCSLSDEQIKLLQFWGKHPVLCFDGDTSGQKGAMRAIQALAKKNIYASVLMLPKDMDLADLAIHLKEKLVDYIHSHTFRYWQYLLREPAQAFLLQTQRLQEDCLPIIQLAAQSLSTQTEKIAFYNYIKNTFKLEVDLLETIAKAPGILPQVKEETAGDICAHFTGAKERYPKTGSEQSNSGTIQSA